MRRRVAAIVAIPLLSGLAAAGVLWTMQSRLPERVVVRWGPNGDADGLAWRGALPILMLGLSALVTLVLAPLVHAAARSMIGRWVTGLPTAVVCFLGAVLTTGAAVQLDGTTAPRLPGWTLPVALLIGFAAGALATWLAGPPDPAPTSDAPGPAGAPRIDLPTGHTAVWSGHTPSARPPVVVAAILTALAVVLASVGAWPVLFVLVPVAGLVLAATDYRVTIGRGMVDVSGRFFGYPRVRIPLDRVAHAEPGTVDAWSFGGWGIRVSPGGDTAVVTRSGPALVVTRTDDAVLRISLDDPERAAAVLTTLLDRRR